MLTATPESVGIPSGAISAFLDDLRVSKFNMHSVLVFRHGKLIAEAYQEPYGPDVKHRMFSISKTYTALGVGLMIDEGKLSLDDKVVTFFPEYSAAPVNPLLAEATVRDMLTMRDPHDVTTHGMHVKSNWLESWFLTPPTHPPGTVFQYNTTSSNLLAAIVERLSGMKLFEYMYPKLLTPLGFSEGCFCGETPDGDAFGGSAVMCTPRDLAKMTLFLMNDGMWEGKQLISAQYIRDMRSPLVDNTLMGIAAEGIFGYGYQTWGLRHGGFSSFGIHGQFGSGWPQHGLAVITTGNTTDYYASEGDDLISQYMIRVYNSLFPALADNPLPENKTACDTLQGMLALPHPLAPGAAASHKAAGVSGKTFKLVPNKAGWKTVRFDFAGDTGKIAFTNRRGEKELPFGMKRAVPVKFPDAPNPRGWVAGGLDFDTFISAGWIDDRTLAVYAYGTGSGYMQINAVFMEDGRITICIKPLEGYRGDYGGYMYGQS
jgi:CubicO group peptidase (beta-lactamase class C family)